VADILQPDHVMIKCLKKRFLGKNEKLKTRNTEFFWLKAHFCRIFFGKESKNEEKFKSKMCGHYGK
jgi:hypothetical protein